MSRIDRHDYYMRIAIAASERSSCPRRRVGAVLALPGEGVISAGYNGSPRGFPHCDEVGCALVEGRCIRTIHAELNAILQGMKRRSVEGASLYTTDEPCLECSKIIINVGVKEVIAGRSYEDERVPVMSRVSTTRSLLHEARIELRFWSKE